MASPIYSYVPRWAAVPIEHWLRPGCPVEMTFGGVNRKTDEPISLPHLQPQKQQWVDELYRDRPLTWNLGVLFCLHSGLFLSAPFKKKKSLDYIVPGLCCLFGFSFGNAAGHPSKCEWKVCKRARREEQVAVLTSLPDAQVQGRICTAWDDLNCLLCGMWPGECLGLPLGLLYFTQELSSTTHSSTGCSSFTRLTVLVRV